MDRYEARYVINGIHGDVMVSGGGGLKACLGGIQDAIEAHERGELFENNAYAGKSFSVITILPLSSETL